MKYYIDVDGCLLGYDHDLMFKNKIKEVGIESAIEWYDSTECDSLKVNSKLVAWVQVKKSEGHEVILWTNRGINQIEMTKRNLGSSWNLFDDHKFLEGKKSKNIVDGTIVDNEVRFAKNGKAFIKVKFTK